MIVRIIQKKTFNNLFIYLFVRHFGKLDFFLVTDLFWFNQFFNLSYLQKIYSVLYFLNINSNLTVIWSFFSFLFSNFFGLFLNLISLKYILYSVNFLRYKYFLKIGLGFKKKFIWNFDEYTLFFGLRHWIIFTTNDLNFYFNIRKRSILSFMPTKNLLNKYLGLTRFLRKETVFKTKGLMFTRVWIRKRLPRAILFARRVKFWIIKLKLSKKQKFL